MTTKKLIKQLFHFVGLDIVRYAPAAPERPFPVLPYVVRELHEREKDDFFFIQVGANDGVSDDPIRPLILNYHLPGLLLEPLPDLFEKSKLAYLGQSQLVFENIAVSDVDGHINMFRVKREAKMSPYYHMLASLDRKHLLKEGVADHDIDQCTVISETFETLLARHMIHKVSLLQIDTEGYDYEIIKLAFAAGMHPTVINYEHCHLSPAHRLDCMRTLDKNNYNFLEVGKDTIALTTNSSRIHA